MAKSTIPTSDPVVKEAIAFFIVFKRLGFKKRQVEVFLFPNKPRPSRKVPQWMQIKFAGEIGIVLTHNARACVCPLGKLVDVKYEVFLRRYAESTQAIEEDQVSPAHIQALYDSSYTKTRVKDLIINLMNLGIMEEGTAPDKIKLINKYIKKGDLIEIPIGIGDTSVKN